MLGMSTGIKYGSNDECQRCGGQLTCDTGTDVEDIDLKGGYKEKYKCIRCGETGTFWYKYRGDKKRYAGACADYDY